MTRMKLWLLTVAGCALVMAGLLMISTPAVAQDDPGEYIGMKRCTSCHRSVVNALKESAHTLALQDVEKDKAPILGDFTIGEDLRTVQFPGETEARPFTADDVAFVIGTGRYTQAYVYKVKRNEYQVLPARWNTVSKRWEEYRLAEAWPMPASDFSTNCAGCHTVGINAESGKWEDDGVQCEACHGPGERHADLAGDAGNNPDDTTLTAVRGAINNATDPQTCGQCHSRGVLAEGGVGFPIHYKPGGDLLSNGEYTLFDAQNTDFWYASGQASHANMQYNEWYFSAHSNSLQDLRDKAGDAAKDSCLSCHSQDYRFTNQQIVAVQAGERDGAVPEAVTMQTARFGVTCTTCHNPHSESGLPNLLTEDVIANCVSCHSNQGVESGVVHHPVREMYEGTTVVAEIAGVPGSHFENDNGPTCATCHIVVAPVDGTSRASHSMTPVMPGTVTDAGIKDACTECHKDQTDVAGMQQLIADIQSSITERITLARAAVQPTSPAWVTSALDFVEGDGSRGIHNYTYADTLLDAVEAELGIVQSGS